MPRMLSGLLSLAALTTVASAQDTKSTMKSSPLQVKASFTKDQLELRILGTSATPKAITRPEAIVLTVPGYAEPQTRLVPTGPARRLSIWTQGSQTLISIQTRGDASELVNRLELVEGNQSSTAFLFSNDRALASWSSARKAKDPAAAKKIKSVNKASDTIPGLLKTNTKTPSSSAANDLDVQDEEVLVAKTDTESPLVAAGTTGATAPNLTALRWVVFISIPLLLVGIFLFRGGRLGGPKEDCSIEVLASRSLGPKHRLTVVSVVGERFLLAADAGGTRMLSRLSHGEPVAAKEQTEGPGEDEDLLPKFGLGTTLEQFTASFGIPTEKKEEVVAAQPFTQPFTPTPVATTTTAKRKRTRVRGGAKATQTGKAAPRKRTAKRRKPASVTATFTGGVAEQSVAPSPLKLVEPEPEATEEISQISGDSDVAGLLRLRHQRKAA